MIFDLIHDNRVIFHIQKPTPKEAAQIATKFVSHKGISPDECKLRDTKIIRVQYDLNGNRTSGSLQDDIIERLENLRIDAETESFGDTTGTLWVMYTRANEMLDNCIEAVNSAFAAEELELNFYKPEEIL